MSASAQVGQGTPLPVFMITCLPATFVCWLIVRGWSVAPTLGTRELAS